MNLERKLKLNNLGQYKFSDREKECLYIIDILNRMFFINTKFNYKQISYLYKLMNLEFCEYLEEPNVIVLSYENKNYFYIETNNIDWDNFNVHSVLINLFGLNFSSIPNFIEFLFLYAYKNLNAKVIYNEF